MVQRPESEIEQILTPQEVEALRAMEQVYAARARLAAGEFASTIDLDEEARGRLIGQLGLHLDGLDFEQRREVSIKFTELSTILGAVVARNTVTGPPTVIEIGLYLGTRELPPIEPVPDPPPEPTTEPKATNEKPDRVLISFQERWLGKLYDPELATKIMELDPEELAALGDRIADTYVGMSIQRLGSDAKLHRAQQLKSILAGDSLEVIAGREGIKKNSLEAGLRKMIESIQKRLDVDELLGLLPGTGWELTKPDLRPLTPVQEKWYNSLFKDPEIVGQIGELNAAQQDYLVERLCSYLTPIILKKLGPDVTRSRTRVLTQFLEGRDIEDMAQERGISEMYLQDELRHSAERLRTRTEERDLLVLVKQAQDFKQNQ